MGGPPRRLRRVLASKPKPAMDFRVLTICPIVFFILIFVIDIICVSGNFYRIGDSVWTMGVAQRRIKKAEF